MSFLCIFVVLFFSSCYFTPGFSQKFSDVDFSKNKNVQITYNELIYDVNVGFDGSKLSFEFCGDDLICGTCVVIDSEAYTISHSGMVFDGVSDNLPSDFLPAIIYRLFFEKGSIIRLDSFNEDKSCVYSSFSVSEHFVTVELYEGQNNKSTVAMTIS